MADNKSKRSFFFLVIDDVGFSRSLPDNKGDKIDFSAYINLLNLAECFDIQIVLACTSQFLDIHRVTVSPRPHENTARIISLIESHPDRFVIADHGYDHMFGNSYCEFYDYQSGNYRPVHEQERHIDQSIAVYESLGWGVPKLFVAPRHAWEPGKTDRLYAERGIQYLTSSLWVKADTTTLRDFFMRDWKPVFIPQVKYPITSKYLKILPRLSLSIPSNPKTISRIEWWKAYHSIHPISLFHSILLHRRIVHQPHNYMAHIGNFAGETNYRQWKSFFQLILEKKAYLVKSFDESIKLWFNTDQIISPPI